MNQTFLTPAALDALGTLAASGFQTPVTIYRRAVGTGSTDYGDDYVTYNQVGRPWPQDTWTSTNLRRPRRVGFGLAFMEIERVG